MGLFPICPNLTALGLQRLLSHPNSDDKATCFVLRDGSATPEVDSSHEIQVALTLLLHGVAPPCMSPPAERGPLLWKTSKLSFHNLLPHLNTEQLEIKWWEKCMEHVKTFQREGCKRTPGLVSVHTFNIFVHMSCKRQKKTTALSRTLRHYYLFLFLIIDNFC